MNIINRSIQKIHQITGLVIALFFVMWFVSGIVLLYHKYPKVTQEETYAHMENVATAYQPSVYDLPGMCDTTAVRTLELSRNLGQNVWNISRGSNRKENAMDKRTISAKKYVYAGDTLIVQGAVTRVQLDSIATSWADGYKAVTVDTLMERGQWILYDRYEKSLPILKYSFDNPSHTEIFMAASTGEVLQKTTRSERIWAYFGAIPHKFYFKGVRTDTERWKTIILIGGLLCLISALSGMYIGVYFLVKNKKKHRAFSSPFKKRMWRYHHVSGLVFGIFLIAWGVSGSLSTQRIPKWMVPYDGDYTVSASKLWGKKPLRLADYRLDYREVLMAYPDVKLVSWEHFGSTPVYRVVSGDSEVYVDASKTDAVAPLNISEKEIEKAVARYFGKDATYTMTMLDDYDEYYLSAKGQQPLPVWKVEIDGEDGARLYVSPTDGYIKYLNDNRMAKKWLFAATHYLDIKYFVQHPALRYACLWILAAGCIFVIVTGVAIYFTKEKNKVRRR